MTAVIAVAFSSLDEQAGIGNILLLFVLAVASGAIEATVVGLAQDSEFEDGARARDCAARSVVV